MTCRTGNGGKGGYVTCRKRKVCDAGQGKYTTCQGGKVRDVPNREGT